MAWEKKDKVLSMCVYMYCIKQIDNTWEIIFDDILLNIFKHGKFFKTLIFNTYCYEVMMKNIKIERMNSFDKKLFNNKMYLVNINILRYLNKLHKSLHN